MILFVLCCWPDSLQETFLYSVVICIPLTFYTFNRRIMHLRNHTISFIVIVTVKYYSKSCKTDIYFEFLDPSFISLKSLC